MREGTRKEFGSWRIHSAWKKKPIPQGRKSAFSWETFVGAKAPTPKTVHEVTSSGWWWAAMAGGLFVVVLAVGFLYILESAARDLPSAETMRWQLRSHEVPRGPARWVSLAETSPELRAAVVASEDAAFYRHRGFDLGECWAAALVDLRTREWRRGGSTITQQVAKTVYLSPEKSLRRKLREALLTWRLEHALTKDEILEAYLNVADWGDGITGAEAAAQFYFAKPAGDLTWAEAALLAAMLPNPHQRNPLVAREEMRRLRQDVLRKLLEGHQIGAEEYWRAAQERLPRS